MPYLILVYSLIKNLFQRKTTKYVHKPTLFGDNSEEHIKRLEAAHTVRQKQMKEGELAQILIGNWFGWEDLRKGHSSGLDCRRINNSIIIELKNRENTVKGSDIKKSLLPTLAEYKKQNPSTKCVWGIVNPDTKTKELTKNELIELCKEKKLKYSKSIKKDELKRILREKGGMKDTGFVKPINNNYKKIEYNGVEIEKIQGKDLFKLVFRVGNIDYSSQIISIIKQYISKY